MFQLEVGGKIKVRNDYTVQIGGDVFQGGELLPVTAKNIKELELQQWKLETVLNTKKNTVEKKHLDEVTIENRAITEPINTRSLRAKLKKES